MVAGAQAVALVVARAEVAAGLSGLTREERWAVLADHLVARARESGQPAVFVALVAESLRMRLGVA
jgi:hypothetical protein